MKKCFVVTGTGTEVGKTITSAAIASYGASHKLSVAVFKPVQTGVGPEEPGDIEEVKRLTSGLVTVAESKRFSEPLASVSAAKVSGKPFLRYSDAVQTARELMSQHELLIIEGAGGLLVPLGVKSEDEFDDSERFTVADIAVELNAEVIVVTEILLGTLNVTALTVEALKNRGLKCAGLVVGSWPKDPDVVARTNLTELPIVADAALLGALPEGLGMLSPEEFIKKSGAAFATQFLREFIGDEIVVS